MLSICAMLSCGNSVFYRPKDHAVHADNARLNFARGGGGDHVTLMRVYNEWVDTNYSTQVSGAKVSGREGRGRVRIRGKGFRG